MAGVLTAVAGGIASTVLITAAAFVIGCVLGMPLALARRSGIRAVRAAGRTYAELVRAVPPLVWIFLVFFGLAQQDVQLSPLVSAVITLGLIAASYLSEIFRSGLSAIGAGQFEASEALGLRRLDSARFVVVPQVLRVVVPTMATYAIGLLKDSALASTIGVSELAFRANAEAQRTGQGLTVFVAVGVVYLLLSLPLAGLSRHVDSRLRMRFSVA